MNELFQDRIRIAKPGDLVILQLKRNLTADMVDTVRKQLNNIAPKQVAMIVLGSTFEVAHVIRPSQESVPEIVQDIDALCATAVANKNSNTSRSLDTGVTAKGAIEGFERLNDFLQHSRWEFSPSAADQSEGRAFIAFGNNLKAEGTYEVVNGTITATVENVK